MTCDDCPGGPSWEDRAKELEALLAKSNARQEWYGKDAAHHQKRRHEAEAELERITDFLAETPAMGWQSAALVWRDRAEEAEAQLAKILEGGNHRGAVLSLRRQLSDTRDRVTVLEGELEEARLRYIEASNPGIDIDEVRRQRAEPQWEVFDAPDGLPAIRMKGHDGLLDPIPGVDESDNPMVRRTP